MWVMPRLFIKLALSVWLYIHGVCHSINNLSDSSVCLSGCLPVCLYVFMSGSLSVTYMCIYDLGSFSPPTFSKNYISWIFVLFPEPIRTTPKPTHTGKSSTWPVYATILVILCPICICTAIGVVAIFIRSSKRKRGQNAGYRGPSLTVGYTPHGSGAPVNGSLPGQAYAQPSISAADTQMYNSTMYPDISKEKL